MFTRAVRFSRTPACHQQPASHPYLPRGDQQPRARSQASFIPTCPTHRSASKKVHDPGPDPRFNWHYSGHGPMWTSCLAFACEHPTGSTCSEIVAYWEGDTGLVNHNSLRGHRHRAAEGQGGKGSSGSLDRCVIATGPYQHPVVCRDCDPRCMPATSRAASIRCCPGRRPGCIRRPQIAEELMRAGDLSVGRYKHMPQQYHVDAI